MTNSVNQKPKIEGRSNSTVDMWRLPSTLVHVKMMCDDACLLCMLIIPVIHWAWPSLVTSPLLIWQLVSRIFGQISANCRIILVSPAAALQLTPVPHSQDKWYQANCSLSHWSRRSLSSLLLVGICGQIISDLSPLDYLWIMSVRSVCLVPPALWKIISPQTTQVRAKFVKIDRKFYADSI